MEVIKRWLYSWAVRNSGRVQAVVCFGSHGRSDTSPSSDLDICVVGEKSCLSDILTDLVLEYPQSLCYEKALDHKILAMIRTFEKSVEVVFRIDCFVVQTVSEVEKYIVGSELHSGNISNIMLFKNSMTGDTVEQQILHMISSVPPTRDVTELVRALLMSFLESFEVASNKRACGDKFQFLFQLQLAYVALVKLEFIRQEGRHFLYLPKMVFPYFDQHKSSESSQKSTRRHFEDDLEPRGQLNKGHAQQMLYLDQFRSTLNGLLSTFPEVLCGVAQSVDHICSTLDLVLQRDRFYNFRDAGCGPLQRGKIYRSGFFELPIIVDMYDVKSVIDLRLEEEVVSKPSVFSVETIHIHCDIFNFGGRDPSVPHMPTYMWFTSLKARAALGVILREVLNAPLPVLIHCVAGKDRTGVVCALLQLLCGVSREQMVEDYTKSLQGVVAKDIEMFVDVVCADLPLFLLSCELSETEVELLKRKLTVL